MAGCSAATPEPGVRVDCWAISCPTDDDAQEAMVVIAERIDLDPFAPLTLEWHAYGEVLRRRDAGPEHPGKQWLTISETADGDLVRLSSFQQLPHEAGHLVEFRGDGPIDPYHVNWTEEDRETEDAAKHDLLMAGLSP